MPHIAGLHRVSEWLGLGQVRMPGCESGVCLSQGQREEAAPEGKLTCSNQEAGLPSGGTGAGVTVSHKDQALLCTVSEP